MYKYLEHLFHMWKIGWSLVKTGVMVMLHGMFPRSIVIRPSLRPQHLKLLTKHLLNCPYCNVM